MPDHVKRAADLSSDGLYRYRLERRWGPEGQVAFIGLNPSTADAEIDDQTVRRCMSFARSWGYDGIQIGNLFALRSTDPLAVKRRMVDSAVGPKNDFYLDTIAQFASRIIACWGAFDWADWRAKDVLRMLQRRGPIYCLGKNKDGSPKHPLYLPSDTEPTMFQDGYTELAIGSFREFKLYRHRTSSSPRFVANPTDLEGWSLDQVVIVLLRDYYESAVCRSVQYRRLLAEEGVHFKHV